MMRSMFSGVSGLRAHQNKMDVIGNNIANVNTVGFKSSRVTFQEVFTQTIRGASSPDSSTGRGGTNPMQVGLGISVGSIDTMFTRGSLQRTDNPTDLAIEGEGFFIVRGSDTDTYKFTRAGNFGLDKQGNLVTASGAKVQGWMKRKEDSKTEFDTEQELVGINIFEDEFNGNKRVIAASATSRAEFTGNLDASFDHLGDVLGETGGPYDLGDTSTAGTILGEIASAGVETYKVPYTVYDKLGNDYTVEITFVKNNVDNSDVNNPLTEWFWYIDGVDTGAQPAQGYLTFDKTGKVDTAGIGAHSVTPTITFIPDSSTTGTDSFDVNLDFTNITMFKTDGSVKATDVNGYPPGEFVTMSIGSDGIITSIYSNGESQSVGQIALAYFENPPGLQKVGGNMFIPTTNSGDFKKGVKPGTGSVGTLSPGTLEMSNVDLSREFTEMITTQRGFQANSRIITTSDEMLQELVNIKR